MAITFTSKALASRDSGALMLMLMNDTTFMISTADYAINVFGTQTGQWSLNAKLNITFLGAQT